jgi:hypothetical protein
VDAITQSSYPQDQLEPETSVHQQVLAADFAVDTAAEVSAADAADLEVGSVGTEAAFERTEVGMEAVVESATKPMAGVVLRLQRAHRPAHEVAVVVTVALVGMEEEADLRMATLPTDTATAADRTMMVAATGAATAIATAKVGMAVMITRPPGNEDMMATTMTLESGDTNGSVRDPTHLTSKNVQFENLALVGTG